MIKPRIETGWLRALEAEFNAPYFSDLKSFLEEEKKKHTIYPQGSRIFAAFDSTPFDKVRVVILGQDPYHGEGQANGLCFSVTKGMKHPPSLQNIFKELASDTGIKPPVSGDLSPWTAQGVLLLNATLTVRAHSPASHQNKGWERFTDAAIKALSDNKSNLVFILWGKYAQAKAGLVDKARHHILSAPHPSPYSASSGFFGCRHFSRTNEIFSKHGLAEIDWSLS